MMPTLMQISELNKRLIYLYNMGIPPELIQFSRRGDKPYIIIYTKPIHDIRETRWFTIDHEGNWGEK